MQECTVSELDLHSGLNLQTSILSKREIAHYPVNSLDGANTIEFLSSGQTNTYRDLSNIMLKLKLNLVKADGTRFNSTVNTATDGKDKQPALITNTLHSLFKQIKISINNKLVLSQDLYHYKAYFELLTNYNEKTLSSNFAGVGAILDTENAMDSFPGTSNTGALERKKLTDDSATICLYGRLSLDISNQPKLLINNLDLRFVLELESSQFVLMEPDTNSSKVNISEAVLYLTHCEINPNVLLYHTQLLSKTPIQYPFMRTIMKTITLPSGIQNITIEHLFTGMLPSFMMIALIQNNAFSGTRSKNPLNLKYYKMKSIQLFKNNETIPQEPLEFNNLELSRAYTYMLQNIDAYNTKHTIVINPKNYLTGFFLNAFNLSPLSSLNTCENISMDGNIRLNLQFSDNLPHTVTALIYATIPDVLEVNSDYNVTTRYQ